MEKISRDELFSSLPEIRRIPDFYENGCPLKSKIVVLDDDPTGTQTVHGIYVYTDWEKDSLKEGLLRNEPVFFVLTNSRGLSAADSEKLHRELAGNLLEASQETGVPFTLVSRSDSTLRGHYPMETRVLYEALKNDGGQTPDGEIIAPFFPEGGRYTVNDIHYVDENGTLVPAGMTEFARDTTFGYRSSDLKDWIREKNPSMPASEPVHSVSISDIRLGGPETVRDRLMEVSDFQKVIVNSADYADMEVFVSGLFLAMNEGKRFIFRTAAGLVRVLSAVPQVPLLDSTAFETGSTGGLVMVGSHVKKSTMQLNMLLEKSDLVPVLLDVMKLTDDNTAGQEICRIAADLTEILKSGKSAAAYTSRETVRVTKENSEDNLRFSVRVSDALVKIVQKIGVKPSFIIAKGGITSSEIGVRGLGVRCAEVAGQILPGVPVWKLGKESRYPGSAYVIFPGNVGNEGSLYEAVERIRRGR